jgi:arylesterase/paraoxonase
MGKPTTSRLPLSLITLIFAAIIYTQSNILWKFVGRANIDKTRLIKWENSKELNNENCQVIKDMNACEDVKIHYASNTAFVACGDPYERKSWYPCAGMRNAAARSEASFREYLFKYDVMTGKSTQLQLHGLEGDFITHGIDIFSIPGSSSKVCGTFQCSSTERPS